MKNPGLKPFQLEGAPFRMRVAPEDSPFLCDILDGIDNHAPDPCRKQAFLMFAQELSDRKIAKGLHARPEKIAEWRKEWIEESGDPEPEQDLLQ